MFGLSDRVRSFIFVAKNRGRGGERGSALILKALETMCQKSFQCINKVFAKLCGTTLPNDRFKLTAIIYLITGAGVKNSNIEPLRRFRANFNSRERKLE